MLLLDCNLYFQQLSALDLRLSKSALKSIRPVQIESDRGEVCASAPLSVKALCYNKRIDNKGRNAGKHTKLREMTVAGSWVWDSHVCVLLT